MVILLQNQFDQFCLFAKVVVAVGESEDDTLALIKSIDPKRIEIVKTVWDDSLRQGGKVLALETNKAFDAVSADFDWCVYIQADEVLHEKDYPEILRAMKAYKDDAKIEGLLFKYLHFWGTYDYIGVSRNWYRHEIRILKNDKAIRSYKDAQGFRKHGRKLQVKKLMPQYFIMGTSDLRKLLNVKSAIFTHYISMESVLKRN